MAPFIEGLQAVTVHVTDLEKARAFYSKILLLEEERPVPNIPRIIYKLHGTTTRLLMHVQDSTEGGREPGTVSGITFYCPDPVAACAIIQKKGGKIVDEPWTMQRGHSTVVRAVIADPDGNEFLLSSGM
ncbi:MAG: VOC family protein [Thermoplasmata archaeon]|nr:VOC family protein [Thermoplasmata archaeon]